MSHVTLTQLEMTSPTQLVPGRPPPSPIALQQVGPDEAALVRSTCAQIGAPYAWTGRSAWSDAQWRHELARSDIHAWFARVDGNVAGLVELEVESNGDVGIVLFGLVPEFVGKGFGGAFLTLATRLAWKLTSTRVWVETSSGDHPHARPNYERRGFRVF